MTVSRIALAVALSTGMSACAGGLAQPIATAENDAELIAGGLRTLSMNPALPESTRASLAADAVKADAGVADLKLAGDIASQAAGVSSIESAVNLAVSVLGEDSAALPPGVQGALIAVQVLLPIVEAMVPPSALAAASSGRPFDSVIIEPPPTAMTRAQAEDELRAFIGAAPTMGSPHLPQQQAGTPSP